MVRTGRLLRIAIVCAVSCALVPGVAQAAARPAARPVASLVDDIWPGPASSDPQNLTAMNGKLYFTARSPRHGRQLWRTNGTAAGTVMLTHVVGPAGADPQDLTVADGVLFFSARDPGHGRQLWRSNGTTAGTTLAGGIVPGRAGSDPRDITYAIGQQEQRPPSQVLVYFSARDPGHGRQLWESDGTAAGTVMITDVNPGSGGLAPRDIVPLAGPIAMFSGHDPVHGREPWVTDGTTAGTHLYLDLNPGPAGSGPAQITPELLTAGIETSLPLWYFSAADGTHGREFFVAYVAPPADVYDINPGPASSDPGRFDSVGQDTGLLAATGAAGSRELFAVQRPPLPPAVFGRQPGTATRVAGAGPGRGSNPVLAPTSQIGVVTSLDDPVTRTYFAGDDAGHGRQLWQADEIVTRGPGQAGTLSFSVAGVRLVAGHNPAGAAPQDLTAVGGTPVFGGQTGATEVFSANDGRHGRQLWYSDGWPGNTRMASGISPGPAGSNPRDITAIGQTAYFSAYDRAHGRELWQLTVPPAPQMSLLGPLAPVGTGPPVTFTATMQPAPGLPQPAGRVTFFENGTKIGARQLARQPSGRPAASLTIAAPPGTHQIVAVYTGDGDYLPATSNTWTLTAN